MHLASEALESPLGWSTGVVWVGDGVAGGAPVSVGRLVGGGGRWVWDEVLGEAPVLFGLDWGCWR